MQMRFFVKKNRAKQFTVIYKNHKINECVVNGVRIKVNIIK